MAESQRALLVERRSPDPADDFFHPVGSDPSWSESYYFYYFDKEQKIGGITRLGFRAHDGWKDHMHIVFLEGRRIVFCYDRQPFEPGGDDLTVGGFALDRVIPFQKWRLTFDGKGQDLQDGRVLITPRRDRPEGWLKPSDVSMTIDFDGVAEPLYMFSDAGERGHFEQPGRCTGRIAVGDRSWEFAGLGMRDKSWGPRPWTDTKKGAKIDRPMGHGAAAGLFTMWITSVVSAELAFAMTFSQQPDGAVQVGGFLFKDGDYHQMLWGKVESEFEDGSVVHKANRFEATFENGHTLAGSGKVINLGPSKIAMPHGATLVNSGLTEFRLDSGEIGLGSSEYWISVQR